MARFTIEDPPAPPPSPGAHVARIIRAKEKTSTAGHPMLIMTARFADLSELGFVITFAPTTGKIVSYFCRSAELTMPPGGTGEAEILPEDVPGRHFYPFVEYDRDPGAAKRSRKSPDF